MESGTPDTSSGLRIGNRRAVVGGAVAGSAVVGGAVVGGAVIGYSVIGDRWSESAYAVICVFVDSTPELRIV